MLWCAIEFQKLILNNDYALKFQYHLINQYSFYSGPSSEAHTLTVQIKYNYIIVNIVK